MAVAAHEMISEEGVKGSFVIQAPMFWLLLVGNSLQPQQEIGCKKIWQLALCCSVL